MATRETSLEQYRRDEEVLAAVRPEVSFPAYWENLHENCESWAAAVSAGAFWKEVTNRMSEWRTEYHRVHSGALLETPKLPVFVAKTAERTKGKVLEALRKKDECVPMFPADGPPVPILNDLVRTRISCLYVDGVEFLAGKLFKTAEDWGGNPNHSREGTIDGYFAQHVTFQEDVYFRLGGGNEPARITCEIQVATLLATRMWDASHPYYEIARKGEGNPEEWQWNPKDPRFLCRQLGHMIHLADGLLVQLRDVSPLQHLKKR